MIYGVVIGKEQIEMIDAAVREKRLLEEGV
jgi:hypothetical protein